VQVSGAGGKGTGASVTDVNWDEVVGLLGLPEVGGQWRSIIGMAIWDAKGCWVGCKGVLGV